MKIPNSVKWTILEEIKLTGLWYYKCKCICGVERLIPRQNILKAKSKQCKSCALIRHGESDTKLYKVWQSMNGRCNNKSLKGYGGKGIKVCPNWKTYEIFRDWSLANGYTKGLTIDRINNDGDYQPTNCRWVNSATQARNTSRNIKVNGIIAQDLANELGTSRTPIVRRINSGWTEEQIRESPVEEKVMNLPKYISYRKDHNQYRVRYGSSGKINIGSFDTLLEAETALASYLKKAMDIKL